MQTLRGQSAAAATGNIVVVQPAHLVVTAQPGPASVSIGQVFGLDVVVQDDGGSAASGLTVASVPGPFLQLVSASTAQDLRLVAQQTLHFQLKAVASGSAVFTANLAGTDATSGAKVAAAAASGAVAVQSPASLSLSAAPLPARAAIGQSFDLSLTVKNLGEATATAVQPAVQPGPQVTLVSAPSATVLAGGASAVFVYRFQAATAAARPSRPAPPVRTRTRSWRSPPGRSRSDPSSSSLRPRSRLPSTHRRRSRTASSSRSPSSPATAGPRPPSSAVVRLTLPAGLQLVAAPSAQDVPGGASVTFNFTVAAVALGPAPLTAVASATDADSGQPLSATLDAGSVLVQAPAALQIASFLIPPQLSTGQAFNALLVVAIRAVRGAAQVVPSRRKSRAGPRSLRRRGRRTSRAATARPSSGSSGRPRVGAGFALRERLRQRSERLCSTLRGSAEQQQRRGAACGPAQREPRHPRRPQPRTELHRDAHGAERGRGHRPRRRAAAGILPSPSSRSTRTPRLCPTPIRQPTSPRTAARRHLDLRGERHRKRVVRVAGRRGGVRSQQRAAHRRERFTTVAIAVQQPAALSIDSLTLVPPATISRGQTFTATLTVRNTGEPVAVAGRPSPECHKSPRRRPRRRRPPMRPRRETSRAARRRRSPGPSSRTARVRRARALGRRVRPRPEQRRVGSAAPVQSEALSVQQPPALAASSRRRPGQPADKPSPSPSPSPTPGRRLRRAWCRTASAARRNRSSSRRHPRKASPAAATRSSPTARAKRAPLRPRSPGRRCPPGPTRTRGLRSLPSERKHRRRRRPRSACSRSRCLRQSRGGARSPSSPSSPTPATQRPFMSCRRRLRHAGPGGAAASRPAR